MTSHPAEIRTYSEPILKKLDAYSIKSDIYMHSDRTLSSRSEALDRIGLETVH